MNNYEISQRLLDFIQNSPSVFHAIENIGLQLKNKGYIRLSETDDWEIRPGGLYYVVRNDSSLIAFRVPEHKLSVVHIAAAHSDCPCFKVKPCCEMTVENQYVKLNVEKYGGMLMAPWLDRPLSVAGRAVIRDEKTIKSVLVNVDRDLLMIPNLAIHMNRQANDNCSWNAQKDMLPLYGGIDSKGNFEEEIASSAGTEKENLLDYDLFLYNRMKGIIWGADGEYISSRSLDDLQCGWSLLQGFMEAGEEEDKDSVMSGSALSVYCIFDNEEVGSLTAQGADSTFLSDTMTRICEASGWSESIFRKAIAAGYMISADNAHAVHPNHPEMADPTNRPYLNNGIVIKYHAGQKYTTNAVSAAMFRQICKEEQIPVQTFTNRSDKNGGSTLGNLSNRHLSVRSVDIGLPQLAMHSPYETAGIADTGYLIRAIRRFFCEHIDI